MQTPRTFALLLALSGLLLLSACPDDDDDFGDDDTADDDDAAAGDADGTVPCIQGDNLTATADVWEVDASAGELRVQIDTVSASTTFDPAAYVTPTGAPDYPFVARIGLGDDERDCTFPPPQHGCPDFTTVGAAGVVYVVVFAHFEGCNEELEGFYSLQMGIDGGGGVTGTLVGDDVVVDISG
jgi:hypothetical protein